MIERLPSAEKAKLLAKQLRAKMIEDGTPTGHAKSLELVAKQHGFRDWNTMLAALGDQPQRTLSVGDQVSGKYLAQPFTGTIVSVSTKKAGWYDLELQLDEAVDVVTFDSFSNMRRRIRGSIGPKGHSLERTSDGAPHLQIDMQ